MIVLVFFAGICAIQRKESGIFLLVAKASHMMLILIIYLSEAFSQTFPHFVRFDSIGLRYVRVLLAGGMRVPHLALLLKVCFHSCQYGHSKERHQQKHKRRKINSALCAALRPLPNPKILPINQRRIDRVFYLRPLPANILMVDGFALALALYAAAFAL